MPILVRCDCGKQFQTGDANAGRMTMCPNCRQELVVPVPKPGSDGEDLISGPIVTRTSRKAVTSLILGIFAFFCSIFAGIPAIIFGAVGLSDIGKSRGRLGGKGMAVTGIVLGSVGMVFGLLMIALMIPDIQDAREAATQLGCVTNIKQIDLAMHTYATAENQFPPASIKDAKGKPLLSWRVAILPYLGKQALYSHFKLDEPWDSPTNMALAAQMPRVYFCPDEGTVPGDKTIYQAIVGSGSLFEGDGCKLETITDGTSNTLAVVESLTPVTWTKPDDVDISAIVSSIGSRHPSVANALFADGSVRFLNKTIRETTLRALCTRNGGEVIPANSY